MQQLSLFPNHRGYNVRMAKKSTPHPFGQRLAKLRHEYSLSQAELGRQLGISRGMVAYYESCAKNPTVEVVEKVASIFKVPVSDLLYDSNSTAQKKPGPTSRLHQITNQLERLPKNKQRVVVQMLEGFLRQECSV